MVTIVAMAREVQHGTKTHRPVLLRVLESPMLVQLGAFSYSLYLVHLPVVSFCDRVLSTRVHGYRFPTAMVAAGVTLSLVIAYLFHPLFERPLMRRTRRSMSERARSWQKCALVAATRAIFVVPIHATG